MKLRSMFWAVLFLWASISTAVAAVPVGKAVQAGTYDSLYAGVYDGGIQVGTVLQEKSLGLGTFHALDGEMVVVDGVVFQVKGTGDVIQPDPSITSPFLTLINFTTSEPVSIPAGKSFDDTQRFIDSIVPEKNIPLAIRIDGEFEFMTTRSFPAQKKPYRVLPEVMKEQQEFDRKIVSGSMVGFRFPSYMKGINALGYHFHFISSDRTFGGHVLSFTTKSCTVQVEKINEVSLEFPISDPKFLKIDFTPECEDK